jgi:UDP-N-acetylmuramoyl-L-alanyl-D-glutamate--2,6-diaminopimelate ligase
MVNHPTPSATPDTNGTGFDPGLFSSFGSLCLQDLTAYSREVNRARAFVAYPGEVHDGRDFIPDAISRGAPAVLWEHEGFAWRDEWRLPNLGVRHLKAHASAIAGQIFGDPSAHLWMVGVTGTNGKTSTSQWIAQSLDHLGKRSAVIGTLGQGLVDQLAPAANTTPDAIVLQRTLRDVLLAGAQACAIEVSSHGLDQGRVSGIKFDVALLTNLTRDHLDYHGTMEAYAKAKASLFRARGLKAAVLNADDPFGRELEQRLRATALQVISYGIGTGDLNARIERLDSAGVAFAVKSQWGEARIESSLLGRFNVSNLLGVLGVLLASGVSLADAAPILQRLHSVEGRMQTLGGNGQPKVVIDYAHSPDALEKALTTLRDTVKAGQHLICVFGCGGDRDRGKRPVMGAIAARLAHQVIVTSDNPRTEPGHAIIDQIVAGAPSSDIEVIEDRREAILAAVRRARAGDVILVAGKGHENYQEIQGVRHAFSDVAVARSALSDWKSA